MIYSYILLLILLLYLTIHLYKKKNIYNNGKKVTFGNTYVYYY